MSDLLTESSKNATGLVKNQGNLLKKKEENISVVW